MSVQQYDSQNKILKLIAGGTLFADTPLGTINAFGGSTAPDGWLLCQGQAVSRTTYADLFAIIGTAFGAGDGSTTFNVPDLRESVPKGAGLTGNSANHLDADGLAVGEFIDDRVQKHTHNAAISYSYTSTEPGGSWQVGSGAMVYANIASIGNNSGRTGDTTEVKSVGVNYIIKATQAALPADIEAALETLIDSKDMLTWG